MFRLFIQIFTLATFKMSSSNIYFYWLIDFGNGSYGLKFSYKVETLLRLLVTLGNTSGCWNAILLYRVQCLEVMSLSFACRA